MIHHLAGALLEVAGRLLLVLALLLLAGCPADHRTGEPPLRPLVYTENPDDEPVVPLPGYEMWSGETDPTAYPDEPPILAVLPGDDRVAPDQVDLSTPEALGRALFRALTRLDEGLIEHLLMPVEDYAQAARTSHSRAWEHMREVRAELEEVQRLFEGEVPSEQRPGGLGGMLRLDSVNVRTYRLVTGEVVRDEGQGEMVLGTEIVLRLGDTEQLFRLRLPKVLRNEAGQWRLAEAPEVGGMLYLFTEMGFHLSPALLEFEHYPVPYQTGNYWTYQVRQEAREIGEVEALIEGESAVAPPEAEPVRQEGLPILRDEVESRTDFDSYALVWISRTDGNPETAPERRAYLLTARRVYPCDRDCRRHSDDIDWLLDHLSRRVPVLVFPLRPGMGWRTGGRMSAEGEYQTRTREELARVPAGRFDHTVCITRSTNEGREHRYFAPGIGVVLTRLDGATTTTYQELIDYRIIP